VSRIHPERFFAWTPQTGVRGATSIVALGESTMARVTVVDDSSEFIDLMRALLAEDRHHMTGFEAVGATVEDIVASDPELLVVDLRLEDTPQSVSGWELIILARAHRDLLDVPVILCSADVFELKKRAADLEQLANVHVLTKPFQVDEMLGLVRQLVAQPEPPKLQVVG
jgi:CheY-like chemotaxis protein